VSHQRRPATEEDPELHAALAAVDAARERPYYDHETDRAARERYYDGVDSSDGAALFRELSGLLGRTHEPRPAYKPTRLVYPWVDLHPDRLLRGVYSGQDFTPEELIRADVAVEAARSERLQELVRREFAVGPAELEAEFDALEAALPFNCEHVVPQSWFAKREPMRGDLHHLFACESRCNSFRGNTPYFDFADARGAVMSDCGRSAAAGSSPPRARARRRGPRSTSCCATRARSATRRASSSASACRCCSTGTAPSRSASTSATATPRSPSCRATATR